MKKDIYAVITDMFYQLEDLTLALRNRDAHTEQLETENQHLAEQIMDLESENEDLKLDLGMGYR